MRYNNDTGGADRGPGCGSGAGRMAGARLRTGPPGQPGASAALAGPPLRKQSHAPGPAAENGAGPPRGPAACPTPRGRGGAPENIPLMRFCGIPSAANVGAGTKGTPRFGEKGLRRGLSG